MRTSLARHMKTIIGIALIMTALEIVRAEGTNSRSGTLLVYVLSVQSSYAQNVEKPAAEHFDSLQWWIGDEGAWRIKTYAIDADIHPQRLGTNAPPDGWITLAKENTKKNYGDVISRLVEIQVPSGLSTNEIKALFVKHGLTSRFDWVPAGYLLWLPDERKYRSQTEPK